MLNRNKQYFEAGQEIQIWTSGLRSFLEKRQGADISEIVE